MNIEPDNILSSESLDALLRAHDGNCALLALWIAREASFDAESAAGDLCMTRAQVDEAIEKLGRILPSVKSRQIIRPSSSAATPSSVPAKSDPAGRLPASARIIVPAEELPDYSAAEIHARAEKDSEFQAVLGCAREIIGRDLNARELGRVLGMYDHLGLPAEVLFVLMHYCLEISGTAHGAPRTPTIGFMEKQAYIWANRGIYTVEAAEEYAEQQRLLRDGENRIRRVLEIFDRSLTQAEKNYIDSWLSLGFEDETIALAYERTLDSIGKKQFPYINTILQRWHEAGLHTAAEVLEKEPARKNHSARIADRSSGKSKAKKPAFVPTTFD